MKYLYPFILSFLMSSTLSFGQKFSCPTQCTPQEVSILESRLNALKTQSVTNTAAMVVNGITYLPIKAYNIRRSNGTTDYPVTDTDLNQSIGLLNGRFLKANIQFYLCGTTAFTYADNDYLYDPSLGSATRPISLNAINLYSSPNLLYSNTAGYSSTPDKSNGSNYVILSPEMLSDNGDLTRHTISHEFGHYMALHHTFGYTNNGYDFATGELVTRGVDANCVVAGDRVCDTPADPFKLPNATYGNPTPCSYTGTAVDRTGVKFAPMMNNTMSYYYCMPSIFTQGQYDRMQYGLKLRIDPTNEYHLDCPPTVVNAPSNCLVLKLQSYPIVSWTDNSTNETGFIIERSSSPTDGFVAIGGVGPSSGSGAMVSFTDNSFPIGTTSTCYYRVKPSNTTTTYSLVAGLQVNNKCGGTWTLSDIPYQAALVVYSAANIVANGIVSPTYTSFNASSAIELKPGFSTTAGNNVDVVINVCIASTPSSARQSIAEEPKQAVPTLEAYPNPTTDRVTINYEVSEAEAGSEVVVFLTTDMGKTIGTLVHDEHHEAGTFSINYSTQHLPEGMYIYSISTNGRLQSKRLVVAR